MPKFPIFRRRPSSPNPPALAPGAVIYAIGDVHGRLDCLLGVEAAIADDQAGRAEGGDAQVVFLGDYVDRGDNSRGVVDHLTGGRFAGLPARHLMGNHEDAMLRFLTSPGDSGAWLAFGGIATLASYGIRAGPANSERDLQALAGQLADRLPADHLRFLRELELSIVIGGFLFVHAGIRPKVPLAQQTRRDLLNIREPFLGSTVSHPWRVVHGHTVTAAPEVRANRIGLDTGAYATGRLSCAAISQTGIDLIRR